MIKQIIIDIFDLAFEISENSNLNVVVGYLPYVKKVEIRILKGTEQSLVYDDYSYYDPIFKQYEKGNIEELKIYLTDLLNKIKQHQEEI